jgi:hypothetical protein
MRVHHVNGPERCRVATFVAFERISRAHSRMAQSADRARSLVVCLDFTSRFMNVFVAKT